MQRLINHSRFHTLTLCLNLYSASKMRWLIKQPAKHRVHHIRQTTHLLVWKTDGLSEKKAGRKRSKNSWEERSELGKRRAGEEEEKGRGYWVAMLACTKSILGVKIDVKASNGLCFTFSAFTCSYYNTCLLWRRKRGSWIWPSHLSIRQINTERFYSQTLCMLNIYN